MSNWIKGKVGDLLQGLESGVSVNGYDRVPMPDERSVLKVSSVTYGIFNSDSAKPIKEKDAGRAKCNPRKGQIIISRSNTPELVGASALVDQDYPHRYLSDKLWQTVPRPNIQLCTKWLAFVLSSPEVRYKLSQLATGSSNSMKNITKDELLSLPVLIPPYSEQKIISNALEQWDAAIEKTEALIDAKERQFGWLIHHMVGENQINDQWPEYSLGELFVVSTHVSKSSSICDDGKNFIVDMGSISRQGLLLTHKRTNLHIDMLQKGELVMPKDDIGGGNIIGKVAVIDSDEKYVCGDHVYRLKAKHEINTYFAKYVINSVPINKRLRAKANGTSQLGLGKKDVLKQAIRLPELSVQQNIANTLNTAKEEIKLLKKLADQYRTQKRGLMQKLLSGEWHIKNKEAA